MSTAEGQGQRISLAAHARRAQMSPLSFHGTKRRKDMGLVDTPGPRGRDVYFTLDSSLRHLDIVNEVREGRRSNKK